MQRRPSRATLTSAVATMETTTTSVASAVALRRTIETTTEGIGIVSAIGATGMATGAIGTAIVIGATGTAIATGETGTAIATGGTGTAIATGAIQVAKGTAIAIDGMTRELGHPSRSAHLRRVCRLLPQSRRRRPGRLGCW